MPKFKIIRVISENIPANWTGPTGYITQDLLTDSVEDILDRQVYVSGPEPMVDAMKDTLLKTGLAETRIHQDWFAGYKDKY
jgi:ferredoxin-NADP reductase